MYDFGSELAPIGPKGSRYRLHRFEFATLYVYPEHRVDIDFLQPGGEARATRYVEEHPGAFLLHYPGRRSKHVRVPASV